MKIGIITLFYKSNNYGGMLQAYALAKTIEKFKNIETEQILIDLSCASDTKNRKRLKKFLNPVHTIKYIKYKIQSEYLIHKTNKYKSQIYNRKEKFSVFENIISHSQYKYNIYNINKCVQYYDLFVTGSDQVWNYSWYNPINFLSFTSKPKISYAASIGHKDIPTEWKEIYTNHLKDYIGISVREEESISVLQPLCSVPVKWVLDPTLLLSKEEWDDICPPPLIDKPYMFCYFLGGSKNDRNLAIEVAKRKNLKIVCLPYLHGLYRSVDKNFGDIQLWEIGPKEFLSLIKNANYVITDSFHGSVFSYLYKIPFVAFERDGLKGMSGRLDSLTSLTNTTERFLNSPERINADYICSLPDVIPSETQEMKSMKTKSIKYLEDNIELARRIINEK